MSDGNDPRGKVVTTGHPVTQIIACVECGVLLWDIDAHYTHAHPSLAGKEQSR